jgi:hypothetical protein
MIDDRGGSTIARQNLVEIRRRPTIFVSHAQIVDQKPANG